MTIAGPTQCASSTAFAAFTALLVGRWRKMRSYPAGHLRVGRREEAFNKGAAR
jgi:hypothetical protein